MARNFSAGQYESAFRPTMLRNWQIPATDDRRKKEASESQKFEPWPSVRHKTRRHKMNAISPKKLDSKENATDETVNDCTLSAWEKRSSHVPIIIDSAKSSSTSKIRCADFMSRSVPDVRVAPSEQNDAHKTNATNSTADRINVAYRKENSNDESILLKKAYSDKIIAQNIKLNNYKHHTLADSIETDPQQISQPWLPQTAAVGCKLYHSPGPTQCSKLKVFRPASKSPATLATPRHDEKHQIRTKSPRVKLPNEMDLAIYWDVTSDRDDQVEIITDQDTSFSKPTARVKRPTTCDGAALSRTKSTVDLATLSAATKIIKRPHSTDCSKVRTPKVNNFIREPIDEPKIVAQVDDPIHDSVAVEVTENANQSHVKERKLCKSNNANIKSARKEKNEYKMAFKAGKPQNFHVDDELRERLAKRRNLRVPKPKTPFAKKSYTIRTLLPPFSIWPRITGYDYPDHWRLVSVYQQSYKPIEARKTSFMKIIFR